MGCSPETAPRARAVLAWAVVGCLIAACSPSDDDRPGADSDPGSDTDPTAHTDVLDTDTGCGVATWQTVGQPFLTTWCTACHGPDLGPNQRQGAPDTVILATESDALRFAGRIRIRALSDDPDMPPVPGPSAAEIARMATYLDCLAP